MLCPVIISKLLKYRKENIINFQLIKNHIKKINIQINHRKEEEDDIQKEIQKHKDELEELKKTKNTKTNMVFHIHLCTMHSLMTI